eukprot:TRINITY_DN51077_c0_g1_i1.p1 TRINITY_DN51077_c0_g1~~TRINITY_DN51077_c0_g1_i1.p1  ORF type:complete len:410 (-),score=34.69 TRINITY_DN51077_c0_g1_i1:291-1520(-)
MASIRAALQSELVPVFLAVFLGTGGYAVMIPVIPKLIDATGSPFLFGVTQSAVSLGSLLGAALLGWYSDYHGCRAAWLACGTLVMSGAALLLLGLVGLSRVGLVLRMNPGVMKALGAATAAHLVSGDATAEARVNSWMGAFFAAGFSLGAPLGGRLSRHGAKNSVGAAILMSALQLCIVFRSFPRGSKAKDADHGSQAFSQTPASALLKLWREGNVPIRVLLLANFFLGLSRQLVISTFQLFTQHRFGTTPEQFGYFLSAVALCFLVANVFVVPQFYKLSGVKQHHFFVAGCIAACFGRMGISVAPSLSLVVLSDLIVAVGDGLVSSSGTTLLSHLAPPSHRGLAQGAGASIQIAAGVVAPALSGWLFQGIGDFAPAAAAAIACVMAALMVLSTNAMFSALKLCEKTTE